MSVVLPLYLGATLQQPYEEPIAVSAMQFKCSVVDAFVTDERSLDNHVRAGLAAEVEVRDEKNALLYAARMKDIPLGFDTAVTVGEFYELSHLSNRYYCENIEADVVTWTLIESYQHGKLFQATFTQELQHANHYELVTDSKIKFRLESLLSRFKLGE